MNDLSVQIKKELAYRELARRDLFYFTKYTMPEFEATDFHKTYYKILDLFCKKIFKKLIVTIGPQEGKSQGSSRQLPAYILGKDPDRKIAIASYASTFAQGFSSDIQRMINDKPYHTIFPGTKLASSPFLEKKDPNYQKTKGLFEIVGYRGSLKAVGRGGGITGNPVDTMILDDIYKDYSEANSPIIRQSAIDWYIAVIQKRLHNDSQQLIVFTRWHEEDLIGWLEEKEEVRTIESWEDLEYFKDNPDVWAKINFPTLKVGAPTELDPREEGEALWEEKHSRASKEKERKLSPEKFESLEQGDPQPQEGLLYSRFNIYMKKPQFHAIKNFTDTADEGDNYLCSICYGVGADGYIYILDVLYTQKPQEDTEPLTAEILRKNKVRQADFESNNGGKGFARAVDKLLNGMVRIDWHPQKGNKEARIKTNAPTVMNRILMPYGWTEKFPEFARALLKFKKDFKSNKFDDAADTLTYVLEFSGLLDLAAMALYRM